MFRTLARRVVPLLAVVFGLLAHVAPSGAQGFEPMNPRVSPGQRMQIELREKALAVPQAQGKRHVSARHVSARHVTSRHVAKRHLRAQRHAHARPHLRRAEWRRAQAKAHRAHHRVARHRVETSVPVAAPARAGGRVEARVDIQSQRMVVSVNGEVAHVWHVSTARKGFVTPRGVYGPKRMHVSYFSKKYYNSPMPYSIFFKGGYAVHGTGAIKALGRPASHGCIRLATGNARTLFNLIRAYGTGNARIVIS